MTRQNNKRADAVKREMCGVGSRKFVRLSAASIFSAAPCCLSRHAQCAWQPTCLLAATEGTGTRYTSTIGGRCAYQCHHKTVLEGWGGGEIVQT